MAVIGKLVTVLSARTDQYRREMNSAANMTGRVVGSIRRHFFAIASGAGVVGAATLAVKR